MTERAGTFNGLAACLHNGRNILEGVVDLGIQGRQEFYNSKKYMVDLKRTKVV
jgi:hypothetical protein